MNAEAEALYQSARAACRDGRFDDGIALAQKALALDPCAAPAHKLTGMALSRLGRHAEALATIDCALALAPDAADIHGSRADALAALGRLDEAVASYDRALALDPGAIADWVNRGVALLRLDRFDEVLTNYDHLIALAPQEADAHAGRGNALAQLARSDEALASYDRALALDPRHAEALSNRGNALDRSGRPQEALRDLDAAIAIDPDHHGALTTRAIVLRKLGRPAEALASCERALALDPNDIDALTVRGDVLTDMERPEDAIATFDRVIAQKPGDVGAKWNKSLLSLTLGRFADGWALYENRWHGAKGLVPRDYHQPRWDGGRLDGTLLIWSEQGLGDEILHSSMIRDVKDRTDDVVLEAEPRLVRLFARSFPDVKVIALAPSLYAGRVDQQEPLGSLGWHFRPSWEAFPRREGGHLIADAARAAALRARLDDGRQVVGLSWISKAPIGGALKSARLTDFAPLLCLESAQRTSLNPDRLHMTEMAQQWLASRGEGRSRSPKPT
jgi:tetratricopeptide (TPR) repeat protein